MSKKMGRPFKGQAKRDKRLSIRVAQDEFDYIEKVTEKTGLSKTETILKAIETLDKTLKG